MYFDKFASKKASFDGDATNTFFGNVKSINNNETVIRTPFGDRIISTPSGAKLGTTAIKTGTSVGDVYIPLG
jgi:hypothetical protein